MYLTKTFVKSSQPQEPLSKEFVKIPHRLWVSTSLVVRNFGSYPCQNFGNFTLKRLPKQIINWPIGLFSSVLLITFQWLQFLKLNIFHTQHTYYNVLCFNYWSFSFGIGSDFDLAMNVGFGIGSGFGLAIIVSFWYRFLFKFIVFKLKFLKIAKMFKSRKYL